VGQTGVDVGEGSVGNIAAVAEGKGVNVGSDVDVIDIDGVGKQLVVSITNIMMAIKHFLKFEF
jgi:hypothetical protein